MTFTKYTGNEAPLTSFREQTNFSRMLAKGVYSGFKVYPDATSTNYAVSIRGGFAAINGILIEDDQDNFEVLDLGAPTDPTGDHHLIWIDNSGDVPVYASKKGTYSSLAELSGAEAENGIEIADVFIPNSAANIQDAVIINRDRILSNQEISNKLGTRIYPIAEGFRVDVSGSDYTLYVAGLSLLTTGQPIPFRFPAALLQLSTSTSSSDPNFDFEITQNDNGASFVVFYTNDTNGFTENSLIKSTTFTSDAELAEFAGSATDSGFAESYPQRPELWDNYIIAIVDTGVNSVMTPFGYMQVGEELREGQNLSNVKAIESTAYGTTVNASAGSIDIDSVIDNAAKLQNATLDTAYDGFEAGASPASGRTINVDGPAVRLIRSNLSDGAPSDKWQSSLEINMNNFGVADAERRERAIDVVIKSPNTVSQRVAFGARRIASIGGNNLIGTAAWTIVGGEVRASSLGGFPSDITIADVLSQYGSFRYVQEIENWYIEFQGSGADCYERIYRVRVNTTGGYFYLEDPNGNTTGISGQFPSTSFVAFGGVFERVVELGEVSRFKWIEVDDIGRKGGGTLLTTNFGFQPGPRAPYDLIEAGNGTGMLPIFPFSTKPLDRASLASVSGSPAEVESDGKYIFVSRNGVGVNQPIDVYRSDLGILVRTILTEPANGAPKITASGAFLWAAYLDGTTQHVEVFDVETGDSLAKLTIPSFVNAIDSTGEEAFIACNDDGSNNIHRLSTSAIVGSQRLGTGLDAIDVSVFGKKIAFVVSDTTNRGYAGDVSGSGVMSSNFVELSWSAQTFTEPERVFVGPSGTYFVGADANPDVYVAKISENFTTQREVKLVIGGTDVSNLNGFNLITDDERLYFLARGVGSTDAIGILHESDFSLIAQTDVVSATETYNYLTTDGLYLYAIDALNSLIYRIYTGRAAGMWVEDYDGVYPRRAVPAGSFLS